MKPFYYTIKKLMHLFTYMTNLGPFRMLADYTKDNRLQQKAFSTYQACLAITILKNGGYSSF